MPAPAVPLVMLNRTAACFAILLMALFSGCSPESSDVIPPVSDGVFLYVDDDAPDAAWEGAARWERATGIVFDFEAGALPVFVKPVEVVHEICKDPGAHACTMIATESRGVAGFAYREDWLDSPDAGNIWTHEFGHTLLRRYGDKGTMSDLHHAIPGVMHEWWGKGGKITEELLTLVCEYNNCTTFVPEVE